MQELGQQIMNLRTLSTIELWKELGRRLNVQYGKIQMVFHGGKPSKFAEVDKKVAVGEETENSEG